jgi:hypothetical protein
MPLIQSPKKKALQENIKTEMDANPGKKNRAQNLAIAYSTQRRNRKNMAGGGDVKPKPDANPIGYPSGASLAKGGVVSFGPNRHPNPTEEMLPINYPKIKKFSYAQGGMAEMPEPIIQTIGKEKYLDEDENRSHSEAAHDRKSMFKMADGGQVQKPVPPTLPQPTSADDFVAGFKKSTHFYTGGQILEDEMPDETDPRAGMESAMDDDEYESEMERHRDRSMKMAKGGMFKRKMMASGGFSEPEYPDAGTLGFPMMEQENDPDEYSKQGIINYADGGEVDNERRRPPMMAPHKYARGGVAEAKTAEERRELTEPTSQRLGEEDYLDEAEYPMSYHGEGQGEYEAGRSFDQENPSIADSIRRKYMASGGMADNPEMEDKGLDQNAIEHTNYMYKLNRQLGDHEMYSEMSALNDLEDPDSDGMDTRDIPMDRYDMVDEIRKKYARNRAI